MGERTLVAPTVRPIDDDAERTLVDAAHTDAGAFDLRLAELAARALMAAT